MADCPFHGSPIQLREANRLRLLEVDRVVSLCLGEGETGPVLDVGTGSGLFAEAFAQGGAPVLGIDLRRDMAQAAKQVLGPSRVVVGDMHRLPLKPRSFELGFLGLVLHETPVPDVLLYEVGRVCRRVAVLEWPHVQEEMGPPLGHRLSHEAVLYAAREAGFHRREATPLSHMVLYRFV